MAAHKAVDLTLRARNCSTYLDIDELSSGDPAMRALIERGKRLIDRELPILILGETGTGKEYLARALHAYSRRRRAAFVALNCASIPENLIESELFGYAKGAFSGALATGMKGKVALASDGTLFLDEIGDMPAAQQTRFLRVLSESEVTPLGAAQSIPVDVQLICATHQDLLDRVERGSFREDLYYRIAVGIVRLPALRERCDRRELIQRMLDDELPSCMAGVTLSDGALELLMTHDWPGNLRQMRAALCYACAVMTGERIEAGDLPEELLRLRGKSAARVPGGLPGGLSFLAASAGWRAGVPALRDEREYVLQVLAKSRWNISAAAREIGMCRASLYRKLKQLGIPHVRDCGSDLIHARGIDQVDSDAEVFRVMA